MSLIDAEPIIKNLSAMEILGYDAIKIDWMIKALREAEKVTSPAPPNDPLTPEELREMDGEPVFIKCLFNESLSSYVVIGKNEGGIFTRLFYASFEYYGDEWLAYRRKPEGES